jgi:hypothetical protein
MKTTQPATFFTRVVAAAYDEARDAVCAVVGDPAPVAAHGATRVHVDLPIGRLRRRVPMRLEISPWTSTDATTWLELVPLRAVRPDRRYYRAGHALLDEISAVAGGGGRRVHVPGQTERRSVDCAA